MREHNETLPSALVSGQDVAARPQVDPKAAALVQLPPLERWPACSAKVTATCDPGTVTNEAGAMAGRSLLASHPAMRPRRRLIACARRQRAIGTPKLAFTDTGISSRLLGQDAARLGEDDGAAGPWSKHSC